jgi:pimeloyl-ACP methyl ester carboxylesterase
MAAVSAYAGLVQGRPCRYWAGGPPDAPPLLLLHGGLGDAALHWHRNFADLSRDFRLLAPTLPAFGATAALPRPSYRAYRAWVAAFCAAVGVEGDLIVAGNSMGAALARLFAAAEPDRVQRLVLIDGGRPVKAHRTVRLLARAPPSRVLVRRLLGALAGSDRALGRYVTDPTLLTPAMRAAMRRGIRTYLHLQSRMLNEPPLAPAELQPRCPILVIWGARDGLASPRRGRQVAEEVGAQAFVVIAGAGHMPMFEQPEEFGRLLRDFVAA